MTTKITKLGLDEYVLELYQKGLTVPEIVNKISEEKNVSVTTMQVESWLKSLQRNFVKRLPELKDKLELLVLNYQKEITTILAEVKEMKNYAKEKKDLKSYDKLVGRLYQGIELLAKIMGDFKGEKKTIDVNIVVDKVGDVMEREFKDMRSVFEVIDVDAEIIEEDKKREEELKKKERR